jgi:hypothetical protein
MHWLRKLLAIVRKYDNDYAQLQQRLQSVENLIRERTDIHADIGFNARDNFAIVVGRYKDRDYIQVHALPSDTFQILVEMLRKEQKHARLRIVDAPPAFSACIKNDLYL